MGVIVIPAVSTKTVRCKATIKLARNADRVDLRRNDFCRKLGSNKQVKDASSSRWKSLSLMWLSMMLLSHSGSIGLLGAGGETEAAMAELESG